MNEHSVRNADSRDWISSARFHHVVDTERACTNYDGAALVPPEPAVSSLLLFGMTMTEDTNAVELATELTIAWLGNPNTRVSAEDVPAFLASMHQAVKALDAPAPVVEDAHGEEYTPAISVRKSLASRDHIISMIDGKPYRTLRRHLATNGLNPDQYRARYNLKADYPMVAETYSEARRAMAKAIGLGRKAGQTKQAATPAAAPRAKRTLKPSFQGAEQAETAD